MRLTLVLRALFVCLPSVAVALPSVPGDLDENGSASVRDVVVLMRHLDGSVPLAVPLIPFADADQDGAVVESDVPDAVDVVLGLPAFLTRMESSPGDGDAEVAVTRETIFRFRRPLSAGVEPPPGAIVATIGDTVVPGALHLSPARDTLTLFYAGNLPASSVIRVTILGDLLTDAFGDPPDVDGDGLPGGTATVDFETLSLRPVPGTSVCGTVLASEIGDGGVNEPLQGVHVTVDGAEATLFADTDAFGNFCIDPSPAGTFFARVNGGTAINATPSGAYYPAVGKAWRGDAGKQVNVGVIHLPLVAPGTLQPVSMTETTTITFPQATLLAHPELAGVHLEVPPDAPYFDDGRRGGLVGIGPVASDRLPGQLPEGLEFAIVITVQTGDPANPDGPGPSNFDVPVPACFPNLPDPTTGESLGVGEKTALWSFNHDTGLFEVVGPATIVQGDGDTTLACTDPGVGILAPGWHGVRPGSGGRGEPAARNPQGRRATPPFVPPASCYGDEGYIDPPQLDGAITACQHAVYRILDNARFKYILDITCGRSHLQTPEGITARQRCNRLAPKAAAIIRQQMRTLLSCMVWGCDCLDSIGLMDEREVGGYLRADFTGLEEATCRNYRGALGRIAAEGVLPLIGSGVNEPTADGIVQGALSVSRTGTLSDDVEALVDHFLDRFALDDQIDAILGETAPEDVTDEQYAQVLPLIAQWDLLFEGKEPDEFYGNIERQYEAESLASLASSPDLLSEGELFYSLENVAAGFVQRGRTGRGGSFGSLPLIADTEYRIRRLFPDSLQYTENEFFSAGSGQVTTIPRGTPDDDDGPDGDGDTLGDEAEFVIGTNPALADSDGDGLRDDAEIRNGSDPLDNAPQSLGVVATVDTPGYARDACTGPNLVAIADSQAGVAVFNVFNGRTPRLVAQIDTPGNASRVAFAGTFVVAADGEEGLVIVDVSDPPAASITHQVDLSGNVVAVAAERGRALVGLRHLAGSAVVLVDLTTGGELGRVAVPGAVHDVAFSGAGALALTLEGGSMTLSSIDLAAPLSIRSAASATALHGGRPLRLATDGVSAWAVHAKGYAVFDVANPRELELSAAPESAQFGWKHLLPDGSGFAFVAVDPNASDDGAHDVSLHDIRAGAAGDATVASFTTPGIAEAVALCGGLGFVADGAAGLQVVRYRGTDTLGVPPTLDLVTNFAGAAVPAGEGVLATARAADDVQVARVEFTVDNVPVGVDCAYPFQARFVVPSELGREVTLVARAFDTGGNNTTAQVVLTTVADPRAPLVVSVTPRPDRITEPVDTMTVVLSKPILFSSVGPASLVLASAGGDEILGTPDDFSITGAAALGSATHSIAFSTASPLDPGVYRLTLAPSVTDLEGHPVAGLRSWAFRVIGTTDDDADGVRDEDEDELGLDPADADSDDDGRLDGDEDPDGDGLSNAREAFLGTDALDVDTDDDGASDRVEADAGCPPTVPGTTTVAGRVLAPGGAAPFEGAAITLAGLAGFATTSAADGTFSIASVPACLKVQVRVRATAGAQRLIARSPMLVAVAGGTTDAMDLELAEPGPPRFQWDCLPRPATGDIRAVTAGDVDGDGIDELLATITRPSDPHYLALARVQADGVIGPWEEAVADDDVTYVTPYLRDVDGDTDLDIVRIGSSSTRIWRGAGDGTFGAPQDLPYGASGGFVAGRFDGDAFVDLLIGGRLLHGQSDGSFSAGAVLTASASEQLPGDLDGDGDLDVVISSGSGRRSFLNDGNGVFTELPSVASAVTMRLADMDGDALLDLVSTRYFSSGSGFEHRLRWERGLGTGSFAVAQETELEDFGLWLEVEDRDGDGDLDVVVGNARRIEVLLNDGTATLASSDVLRLPNNYDPQILAELDGTTPRELVAGGVNTGRLVVVPVEPPAGFASPGAFTLGAAFGYQFDGSSRRVLVADVTGDGLADVVAPLLSDSPGQADVVVLPGAGAGELGPPLGLSLSGDFGAMSVAMGDFDEDGKADLVAVSRGSTFPTTTPRSLVLAIGDGHGGFTEALSTPLPGSGTGIEGSLAVADLDLDGHGDVVVGSEGRLDVFRGFGDGTFAPASGMGRGFGQSGANIVAAELTGDGIPDLAFAWNGIGIAVLPGVGDGTFGARRDLSLAQRSPGFVAAGDLDGDGDLDLVGAGNEQVVQPWLNDGAGMFTPGTSFATDFSRSLELADLNLDDVADIVHLADTTVHVFVNAGDATFGSGLEACTAETPQMVGVGDLDADGLPDLVGAEPGNSLGTGQGGVEVNWQR